MTDSYTQWFVGKIREMPAGEERRQGIRLLYDMAEEVQQEALKFLALVRELKELEFTLDHCLLEPWAGATAIGRVEAIFKELLESDQEEEEEHQQYGV